MARFRLVARHWDQITSKPHEPPVYKRHRAGDIVDIPKAEADRLLKAGAIEPPGRAATAPKAAAVAEPAPEPVADTAGEDGAEAGERVRPKLTATTGAWQEYAIGAGLDPDEVVDMDRDEIIAKLADQ